MKVELIAAIGLDDETNDGVEKTVSNFDAMASNAPMANAACESNHSRSYYVLWGRQLQHDVELARS